MAYYDFIPVNQTRRTFVNNPVSRSTFIHPLLISGTFTTVTEVHVGSGIKDFNMQKQLPISLNFKSADGQMCIPGSSFKGVVAKNFLVLSGSAEMTSEVFGTTYKLPLISKTFFWDIIPKKKKITPRYVEIPRLWSPKKKKWRHVKVYTHKRIITNARNVLLLEAIPKGTKLDFKISGMWLRNFEIGGLLVSLGVNITSDNPGNIITRPIKLGYAKPLGLGRILLDSSSLKIVEYKLDGLKISKKIIRSEERTIFFDYIRTFKKKADEVRNKIKGREKVDRVFNLIFGDE